MGPISIFYGLAIILILFVIVLLVVGGLWTLVFALLRRRRPARSVVVTVGVVLGVALVCFFLAAVGSVFGLDKLIPVSERSMVGTYIVHYRTDDGRPAGNDTLILKPDHTFIQICLPEKGQKIEATIDRCPVKKYERVRMTGTWHRESGNRLQIEGMLGSPHDGYVAGNPYVRYAPSSLETAVEWSIGGPQIWVDGDSCDAMYFQKVKPSGTEN